MGDLPVCECCLALGEIKPRWAWLGNNLPYRLRCWAAFAFGKSLAQIIVIRLKLVHTVLQGIVIVLGERVNNRYRSDGRIAVKVLLLPKIEGNTNRSARNIQRALINRGLISNDLYTLRIGKVELVLGSDKADINVKIDNLTQTELVIKTYVCGKITIKGTIVNSEIACSYIWNKIPETSLLVTTEGIGNIPHRISVGIAKTHLVSACIHIRGVCLTIINKGVYTALETNSSTNRRSEPLSNKGFANPPVLGSEICKWSYLLSERGVETATKSKKPICPTSVSEIRPLHHITVCITVSILLGEDTGRPQGNKRCNKYSKQKFNVLHIFVF